MVVLVLGAGLVLTSFATRAAAQVPPVGRWNTIESVHFRVTYAAGLDALARHAAERAEIAHERLTVSFTSAPAGKIDVVLTDNVDITNGYATPFPSNRIVIFARPPADVRGLDFQLDWIDLVITHELTHSFHLDRAGRVGRAMRAVFGRLPLIWPMFPAAGTPQWSIEGLATHFESDFTGAGRVHGSHHDMVLRTAVLANRFDPFERVSGSSPIWPGDERVYIYGSMFMDYLSDQYGADVRRRLVDRTASAVLPPALAFDRVGRRAIGKGFREAYREWRETLESRYTELADSLHTTGLTAAERITSHGRYALHPRISPDGEYLAYAAQDGRRVAQTRVIDLGTGRVVREARRNGVGPTSWFAGRAALAFSQLEYSGPYHLLQDLYVIDESGAVRLTEAARLQDPDVDRDGTRMVAVENGGGTNRLVVFHPSDRSVRVVADFDPDVNWALPRWSPAGHHIAAGRWETGGEYDVVVVDTLGDIVVRLTRDRAVAGAPAWSPDGRYIVFASDRTGITNLYAADLVGEEPTVRQVSNVLTGAFYPDISPDGRWIYFSAYHADGYHIARMPFDPSAWRDLPPLRPMVVVSDDGSDSASPRPEPVSVTEARAYSAWNSVLPKFWMPIAYESGVDDLFIGALSAGSDLLGRHAWTAAFAVAPADGRFEGLLTYVFAGLGNPVLSLTAWREWEPAIGVLIEDSTWRAVASEDVVSLAASLVRRRVRSSGALTAGVEAALVRREVIDAPAAGLRHPDARDELLGLFGRAAYANFVTPVYAISREDGVSVSVTGRTRRENSAFSGNDQGYNELAGLAAAYKALPLPGFANHVTALRASGLARSGDGAEPSRIGGASGGFLNALGVTVAGESRLLPVRGFPRGQRAGTNAWTASAEYRLPLALVGRRPTPSPLFIDRVSATLFADAGDAWCTGAAATRYRSCQEEHGGATSPRSPLVSAGAELVIDAALTSVAGGRLRFGGGVPVRPSGSPIFYVQFGSSF